MDNAGQAKILVGDHSDPASMKLRQHCDERLIGMRVDRYSWWVHWRELADYVLPRRYKWLITPNQAARGSPINQRIMDNTATIAARIQASGMMAGMTSPTARWFRMTCEDADVRDDYEVKLWLDMVRDRMLTVLAQSNYYTSMATVYSDLGVFGSSPMVIYEDFNDVVRCYNSCAGEYYLANSDRMEVDTLYREFVMTTRQVAQKFGVKNCSPTVQQAVASGGANLTREVIVAHAIEPNDNTVPAAPGTAGRPYREVYWEWGSGNNYVLSVKGFHECPFIAPRWEIAGNDAYGRSPGMDALGDIKQLQVEQKRKAQGIDKMVNPPLVADAALKNEPASLLPGGVTYLSAVSDKVGFKPVYMVDPKLDHLTADIKTVQERIRATFFNDLFMMISQLDTVRSATEIDARREEKLIQLGPVLERFENEALDPSIERVFQIMMRARLLPPPPPKLRGRYVKVEYVSMLADMQRALQTAGIERLASFVGSIAGAYADVLDNVDWDEMTDEYADFLGVSPKIVRPMALVLKMRAQRAQQMAQQQAMQNGMAAVQGAQTLSQTNVGGGRNALQMMMGS